VSAELSKQAQLEAMVPGVCAVVPFGQVLQLFDAQPATAGISDLELSAVSSVLGLYGFALEPDPEFGGSISSVDTRITIFRQNEFLAHPSEAFIAERLRLRNAVAKAIKVNSVRAEDARAIASTIKLTPGLSDAERVRLIAYLCYIFANGISECERNQNSELRIAPTARSDPAPDVPQIIHIQERPKGTPLPRNISNDNESIGIVLDGNEIDRTLSETRRVRSLLSSVLDEADADTNGFQQKNASLIQNQVTPVDLNIRFPGLDAKHSCFLEEILKFKIGERINLDALARTHELMLDGAIETINDWVSDHFGEPLIENDEILRVAYRLKLPIESAA
jgi:TerB-C domain